MGKYLNSPKPTFSCGVCGEDVRSGARACPSCGADERTGLHGEGAESDGLDLPGESADFSYDDFMKREFGRSPKPAGMRWVWWLTAALLLAISVFGVAAWFL